MTQKTTKKATTDDDGLKNYEIVIEDTRTELRSKMFKAKSLKAAIDMAVQDNWESNDGWEFYDSGSYCDVRDDLCHEIEDDE